MLEQLNNIKSKAIDAITATRPPLQWPSIKRHSRRWSSQPPATQHKHTHTHTQLHTCILITDSSCGGIGGMEVTSLLLPVLLRETGLLHFKDHRCSFPATAKQCDSIFSASGSSSPLHWLSWWHACVDFQTWDWGVAVPMTDYLGRKRVTAHDSVRCDS